MGATSSRQAYLDWLRIFTILAVFFLHSSMAYVEEWGWHIKNKETSNLLMELNYWLGRFRMPLLFFISGTVVWFILQKRTTGLFIGLRFRRLFIPLVFGILVIVPPQVYMERLTQGFKGNFLDFYATVFTTGGYPKGNFSWHHLWFILYLFIYDVLLAPLFKWLMSDQGRQRLSVINKLAAGKRIYLLALPSIIIYTSLTLSFPETHDLIHDWCRHPYWITFLLTGFLFVNYPALMDSLERNRRLSFLITFVAMLVLNYLRWNDKEPFDNIVNWRSDWRTYAFLTLLPLSAWSGIFTAVGYAKRYLNKPHRVQTYINEAIYPFYILHQTIIVIVVYYVVETTEPVLNKLLFTLLTSFILIMCIYHLLIRPYNTMRFLFGMKPKKQKEKPVVLPKGNAPALQLS